MTKHIRMLIALFGALTAATAVTDDDVVEADASFGISTSEIERDSGYGNPNAGKFEYCGPESDIVPREARE